jgi:hypothetical protein
MFAPGFAFGPGMETIFTRYWLRNVVLAQKMVAGNVRRKFKGILP